MEYLMQNDQVAQDGISGWWRRAWTATLRFADAIETGPTEYVFDRISYLEREVESLKNELQNRVQTRERHHD
jgi:hypothetical protein